MQVWASRASKPPGELRGSPPPEPLPLRQVYFGASVSPNQSPVEYLSLRGAWAHLGSKEASVGGASAVGPGESCPPPCLASGGWDRFSLAWLLRRGLSVSPRGCQTGSFPCPLLLPTRLEVSGPFPSPRPKVQRQYCSPCEQSVHCWQIGPSFP